jgi:hypothetical protein
MNKHKSQHYKHAAHAKKMQKYVRNIEHRSSLKFSTKDVLIYSGRSQKWPDKLARDQRQRSKTKRKLSDFYI